MLKAGLIGIGFMGRVHLDSYIRLEEEEFPVKLTAICDIDSKKFDGIFVEGNIDIGAPKYDFSRYKLYTDIDEMLEKEKFDYIDIALPTYLHAVTAIKALNKGINVLCEKPMALNTADSIKMAEEARRNKRRLMIAQCLRFWPEYEYLKECVESSKFGKVLSGYFFRGGGTGTWSYQNWFLKEEKSGGCILDQHIHDVDLINWLFGKPAAVSTIARKVIPGSGYDMLSTNYFFEDGKIINAQDDWTLNGDYGFQMVYRVNFEKGNLIYEGGVLKVNPEGYKGFVPDLPKEFGYYREIRYFAKSIIDDTEIKIAAPESVLDTMKIVEAEIISADNKGQIVSLK